MGAELKNLLWLQWRLTRAMFRSRRAGDRWRMLGLLLKVLGFVFTLPMFVLMGAGLAVGMILLTPGAAYEVAMIVNTFLFLIWLILPASYNSQMIERFEMSRLFLYPVRYRTIVLGSTLMALLTATGLWTVPLLLGEIVGFTYHQPLAFPLILLGAVPVFTLLVLSGRIMEDFFDLVAGDRRLRALVLGLLSLPFIACWLGQYVLQFATDNFSNLPGFLPRPFQERLTTLGAASGPAQFLEMLGLSRLLLWLPPGWATAGMGMAARGAWAQALMFLALSTALVGLLLWVHAGITRRLMQGAALSVGVERVRSQRWGARLPGPAPLWALVQKDWIYLWRSPMPRRMIFSVLIMIVAMLVPLRSMAQRDAPEALQAASPLLAFALVGTFASMALNLGLAANYFGTIDREGFAVLALSAHDRRYTLLALNLVGLLYAGAQYLVIALVAAMLTGHWEVLPLGLCLGLCLQVGGAPAYNLAAIIGPYRAQLKFSSGTRQRGNLWGMLAWIVSAPPVLALVLIPYVLWRPGLMLTLPLAVAYSLGLYALTLKPLANLLQRREHAILQAVTSED